MIIKIKAPNYFLAEMRTWFAALPTMHQHNIKKERKKTIIINVN